MVSVIGLSLSFGTASMVVCTVGEWAARGARLVPMYSCGPAFRVTSLGTSAARSSVYG